MSINKNPPKWENSATTAYRVMALNCQSLQKHFIHIKNDKMLYFGDVICLSETWMVENCLHTNFQLHGFVLHTNSVGYGKGLATYFKQEIFKHAVDIKELNLQLTKLTSVTLDVVSVYRSRDGSLKVLADHILSIVDSSKTTVICGDFNVCTATSNNNHLTKTLKLHGFLQLVNEATHIKGGHIDHVYVRQGGNQMNVDVSLYSPYYAATDHDALLITLEHPGNT